MTNLALRFAAPLLLAASSTAIAAPPAAVTPMTPDVVASYDPVRPDAEGMDNNKTSEPAITVAGWRKPFDQ